MTRSHTASYLSLYVAVLYPLAMAGELNPKIGEIGVARAKRWLDYSTRVASIYTNTDKVFRDLLHFDWPYGGQEFSFDLGGKLRNGHLHDQSFMVEVKNRRNESSLPQEFIKFIAECYVAFQVKPERCDNLIWLSWAPFQAQKWDQHTSADTIRKMLLHKENIFRVFGTSSEEDARMKVDEQVILELRQRLWLLTLCDQQEELVITSDHYQHLVAFMGIREEEKWPAT